MLSPAEALPTPDNHITLGSIVVCNAVCATAGLEEEDVGTAAAGKRVITCAANQHVVPRSTIRMIRFPPGRTAYHCQRRR